MKNKKNGIEEIQEDRDEMRGLANEKMVQKRLKKKNGD